MVWIGTRQYIISHTTIGDVTAFILYINLMFRPIRELADKFNTLQMGMVSSERIFKVMDTISANENKGIQIPNDIKGEISFENVVFAYNNEDWVLNDISFHVKP